VLRPAVRLNFRNDNEANRQYPYYRRDGRSNLIFSIMVRGVKTVGEDISFHWLTDSII